ncbi:hypothetical protein RHSIM_Rhsim11G0170800 [Rhododendron simsii]|uniref:DPH-type MB domain-containing protein n=1 Tax=Rhododendron simsii TaxID=118357 RepID=A0A834G986_RHOSS|nr:hypothetical protein RHSIM_Rhsim11G0170800 [Rhododendron simsii]
MSYDDVEIEDMEWNEELQAFTYPCPCGDLFQITKDDLKLGEEIARCPSCSLYITVIYNLEDFLGDSSKQKNLEPPKQQPIAFRFGSEGLANAGGVLALNLETGSCLRGTFNASLRKIVVVVDVLYLSISSNSVMDYPYLHFSFKLDNFEHATMFLHLAIFSGFTLCAELTHSSGTTSGVSGVLASSVFGQELFLLHYHSADHVGLEGHYHWLLQVIVLVSLISSLSSTSFPSSFPAALCLGISVVFQGCWFLNMGFMLWIPKFVPRGCVADYENMHGAVTCLTHEAGSRAMALANMQFGWILAGIMILASCISLKQAMHFRPRGESAVYEQLHSTGANISVAITGFKQPSA